MGSTLGKSGILLWGSVLLCWVGAGYAQDLGVTPDHWNYGAVAVGTSATATFNLESLGPTAVWTYYVILNETEDFDEPFVCPIDPLGGQYTLGAFSFNPLTLGFMPREMPIGEIFPVDVIFTPPSPGYYSVYLGIENNDSILPPGRQALFLLEGTGVPAVPVPGAALLCAVGLSCAGGWLRKHRTR